MSIRHALLALGLAVAASAGAAPSMDPVVQMIRQSTGGNARLSVCVTLKLANSQPGHAADEKRRSDAIRTVTQKIKNNDPNMLRARADAARLGLYGFKQDPRLALALYKKARSPDAGFDAALMLYRATDITRDPKTAKAILDVLYASGAAMERTRGAVGGQAHYIAGVIQEGGYAGKVDMKKAFTHYRASARNTYVPGIYQYLRLLIASLPHLTSAEQQVAIQEIRLMTNRWRWQSPEIMMLNGDMFAGGWFPDEKDGYFAQYHWRLAQRMGNGVVIPNIDAVLQQRVKRLSRAKEERIESDVQAALRNIANNKHELEFSDLCTE